MLHGCGVCLPPFPPVLQGALVSGSGLPSDRTRLLQPVLGPLFIVPSVLYLCVVLHNLFVFVTVKGTIPLKILYCPRRQTVCSK